VGSELHPAEIFRSRSAGSRVGVWLTAAARRLANRNRGVRAQLDRRLARWRRRYPDLETESVAVHGSMQSCLAENGRSVKLIALGSKDPRRMEELIGPAGCAAITHTDCSLLVVNRRHP
jgi:hypothetical protein